MRSALISIADLELGYGGTPIISALTCQFGEGLNAIVGPSGSGKSSLLRVIAGRQPASAGTIAIDGSPVRPASWVRGSDERVALIHQDYQLIPFLSLQDNVALAAEVRGQAVSSADIADLLHLVGLSAIDPTRATETLSGGEQQRVAIARSLMTRPRVLLADEPTGALDSENTDRIVQVLLDAVTQFELLVIVATHDPLVARAASRVWTLRNGELRSDG